MINELITYIKDGLYFGFITCAYLETMFTIDLYLFDASLLANSVNGQIGLSNPLLMF